MALNYYDTTNVITTSQPVELDPESILYQSEDVWKKYKRLSRRITVFCVGPGLLYVRASHDGTYFSEESVIYEGQSKDYDEIYVLKLRSPSANLRYRVTEYNVSTVSGQQFTGIRFKERRDRNGVVVFQDDYESPTIKFEGLFFPRVGPIIPIAFAPPPATIVRSTDTAYSGDFSMKTVGGPNAADSVVMVYEHPDFHVGKIANQIHFATKNNSFLVNLELDYYDGTHVHQSAIAFLSAQITGGNICPVKLSVATPNGEIEVATGLTLYRSMFSWNILKLAVDISTLKYVAAFVNGERIDLSGFEMITPKLPDTTPKHVNSIIENDTTPDCLVSCNTLQPCPTAIASPATIYFDNYIFTEDETFT
jgi:hypothetical protein